MAGGIVEVLEGGSLVVDDVVDEVEDEVVDDVDVVVDDVVDEVEDDEVLVVSTEVVVDAGGSWASSSSSKAMKRRATTAMMAATAAATRAATASRLVLSPRSESGSELSASVMRRANLAGPMSGRVLGQEYRARYALIPSTHGRLVTV
jgi:hypothetical protein